ncbi:hypothetical protein [Nocardia sp. CA-145437]|uniref:hypothetical protein n=1 Tax=Nocardia sp. CA-145437 TaxID=3239980 RepID=UPI003D962F6D
MSTRTSITVGTADLRQALSAVRVHATADKDLAEYHRIRLVFGPENVVVTATDRFTAGLAIVSQWDSDADTDLVVELLPDDVAKILGIFKAGGKELGETPEYMVRFEIDEQHVTLTDCSGMIDGRALRVPRLATQDALDAVPGLIYRTHAGQQALLVDMTVSGDSLARFKVAAAAYGSSVAIEARGEGRALLIRCGEAFLGVMSPRRLTEDDVQRAGEWAEAWGRRLPEIASVTTESGGE